MPSLRHGLRTGLTFIPIWLSTKSSTSAECLKRWTWRLVIGAQLVGLRFQGCPFHILPEESPVPPIGPPAFQIDNVAPGSPALAHNLPHFVPALSYQILDPHHVPTLEGRKRLGVSVVSLLCLCAQPSSLLVCSIRVILPASGKGGEVGWDPTSHGAAKEDLCWTPTISTWSVPVFQYCLSKGVMIDIAVGSALGHQCFHCLHC